MRGRWGGPRPSWTLDTPPAEEVPLPTSRAPTGLSDR
jgi:hypothetical protein